MSRGFTAKQYAGCLGVDPRTLTSHALAEVQPDGAAIVSGVEARTWSLGKIPGALRQRLELRARELGWRDAESMLSGERSGAQGGGVAIRDVHPAEIQAASRLRDALSKSILRKDDTSISVAEFEAKGAADYLEVMGHSISARNWRRIFDRTLQRAGSDPNLTRLELYLSNSPRMNPKEKRSREYPEIQLQIDRVKDAVSPTDAELKFVWDAALACYQDRVGLGESPKVVTEGILKLMFDALPSVAASRDALRKTFARRLDRWMEAGGAFSALADQRVEANKARAFKLSDKDRDSLIGHALFKAGSRISQAWREIKREGCLSPDLDERYTSNPARKSYVPRKVRESISSELKILTEIHHSPTNARDNGAWVNRDWKNVPSFAWYCADDATLPVYFWVVGPDGEIRVTRGQFLLLICARTTCVIGFALLPTKTYGASQIRSLFKRVGQNYGLPGKGFMLERGIWKSSKLIGGAAKQDHVPWEETELGLREFGLQFIHCIRARSKPVERVLGALQSLMEAEPGYAGRDERRAGFEHMRDLQLAMAAGRVDPRERLHSMESWENRLTQICEQYNAERQEGKHTEGLSPKEALAAFVSKDCPVMQFDERTSFLLDSHKRPRVVGKNGVRLDFGSERYFYKSKETGPLEGQQVLAWFDWERRDFIHITDLERRNPILVPMEIRPSADNPNDPALAAALGQCEDHMAHSKTRFRMISGLAKPPARKLVVDRITVNLGAEMKAQREAATVEVTERRKISQRADLIERESGIFLPPAARQSPQAMAAAEEFMRLQKELSENE